MSLLPSADRLAAIGLAIAGATILALAFLVVSDLKREAELHREVISVQGTQDSLEVLRVRMNDLVAAADLAAATGDADAFRSVERWATDISTRLDALRVNEEGTVPGLEALLAPARLLVVHARSVAPARASRGASGAAAVARDTGRIAGEASLALERAIAALTTRVNERTLARIRVGESLRRYVGWFVGGSVLVLAGLFLAFRRVQAREREALRRVEWLAHFDSITALPNRALLGDRLAQEAARGRRTAERFAVVLFDLDGFKEVNDTWGHAAGDRVLATVAERARHCMRASDTLGRLGGDEFMAILPQTDLAGACQLAEKLRAALCEPYPLEGATAQVGVSFGVSAFPAHGEDADALQRAADVALYQAKREGKNRVRVAPEEPPTPRPRLSAEKTAS